MKPIKYCFDGDLFIKDVRGNLIRGVTLVHDESAPQD